MTIDIRNIQEAKDWHPNAQIITINEADYDLVLGSVKAVGLGRIDKGPYFPIVLDMALRTSDEVRKGHFVLSSGEYAL